MHLVHLLPERASFSESASTTARLAQNRWATRTKNNSLNWNNIIWYGETYDTWLQLLHDTIDKYLSMWEYSGYVKAARAFNVHKKAIRRLNQPLELVLYLFICLWWVKQILRHCKIDLEWCVWYPKRYYDVMIWFRLKLNNNKKWNRWILNSRWLSTNEIKEGNKFLHSNFAILFIMK